MTTLASRIRELAERRGYWMQTSPSAMRWERREIAYQLGCKTEAVTVALNRTPKRGRPRNPALTRCEKCGQPLASAPRAAEAASTEPTP
jgi:hypothetical protein